MIENEERYEHIVFGACHAIGLRRRGPQDPHVCLTILVEDDGNWFETTGLGSSFWLKPFKAVINDTIRYLEANCIPHEGGWRFKR